MKNAPPCGDCRQDQNPPTDAQATARIFIGWLHVSVVSPSSAAVLIINPGFQDTKVNVLGGIPVGATG